MSELRRSKVSLFVSMRMWELLPLLSFSVHLFFFKCVFFFFFFWVLHLTGSRKRFALGLRILICVVDGFARVFCI